MPANFYCTCCETLPTKNVPIQMGTFRCRLAVLNSIFQEFLSNMNLVMELDSICILSVFVLMVEGKRTAFLRLFLSEYTQWKSVSQRLNIDM